MEVRITYSLSDETRREYKRALEKVEASKEKYGSKVIGVEIEEIAPGRFAGVIVLNQPV